jgi:hypothetical protein
MTPKSELRTQDARAEGQVTNGFLTIPITSDPLNFNLKEFRSNPTGGFHSAETEDHHVLDE